MKAAQVVSGLGWTAATTVLNAAAQFAFLAALARLLDSEAFGIMAMAIISLRFVSYFAQLGFAQALIQKPELRPEDTAAAALMAAALSAGLYLVVLLTAPAFAAYFRAPELSPVLAGFGASLLLGTWAGLPCALLRRQGRFKDAAAVETAGYVIGFGAVGIAAATAGWGVWALVAATMAQQGLTLALGLAAARPALAWPASRETYLHLWRFGSRYSAIGFLEFVWANVETLAIGRSFGKAELGVFNRAITLTNLPVEQAVTGANKVMFPAFAALSGEQSRLADAFCMLLLGVGIVAAALSSGIAAAATDVVALLLGAQWADAVPIVAVVAFAVPPMFMFVVCGMTLDSVAALGPKLRLQAGLLIVKVALVAAATASGLTAVAAAVVAAELLRLGLGLRLVGRTLGVRQATCWVPVVASAGIGAAVYVAVLLASTSAQSAGWPLAARIGADIAAGTCALGATLLLLAAGTPGYAPLARFETVRRWHHRLLAVLHVAAVRR